MVKIIKEINFTKLIFKIAPYKIYKIFTLYLKPYNSYIQLKEALIDLIHLDILGPFKTRLNSSQFIIIFLYNITQLLVTYYIKFKADIFNCFKNFK